MPNTGSIMQCEGVDCNAQGGLMTHVEHVPAPSAPIVAHKLDAAAWGVFFVWVGIALIADASIR